MKELISLIEQCHTTISEALIDNDISQQAMKPFSDLADKLFQTLKSASETKEPFTYDIDGQIITLKELIETNYHDDTIPDQPIEDHDIIRIMKMKVGQQYIVDMGEPPIKRIS
jgi:hypothetical protein